MGAIARAGLVLLALSMPAGHATADEADANNGATAVEGVGALPREIVGRVVALVSGAEGASLAWPRLGVWRAPKEVTWVPVVGFAGLVAIVLGLALVGFAFQLALPGLIAAAANAIDYEPWRCAGLGAAVLVATPVAVGLLFVSVIGIPLALVGAALFVVGAALALVAAGRWMGARMRRRIIWASERHEGLERALWTAIGVVAVALLSALPWIGPLVLLATLVLGLGATTTEAWRRLRTAPAART